MYASSSLVYSLSLGHRNTPGPIIIGTCPYNFHAETIGQF